MSKLDPNVEAVRELLSERSKTAIKKYGGTTEDAFWLDAPQWAARAQQELLDGAVYLQCLIERLAVQNNEVFRLRELNIELVKVASELADKVCELCDDYGTPLPKATLDRIDAIIAKSAGAT